MPTYATQDDFEAYVEGFVTDNPAALDRLLERAEKDIDYAAGFWPVLDATNNKFGDPAGDNELGLTTEQVDALRDATCAQAQYRLQMGEDFFVEHQRQSSTGPDTTEVGRVSKIGPLAQRELIRSGLLRLTGRFV